MSVKQEADALARELFETRSQLRAAGRALHDQVGPLLSAAGIRLALLRSDHPQTAPTVEQTMLAVEEAMERIRALSRQLNPPPAAHLGLRKSLSTLVETQREGFPGEIGLDYAATAQIPEDASAALYEAAAAALAWAVSAPPVTQILVRARGSRSLIVTIACNGGLRWPRGVLAAMNRRARPAGIVLEAATEKSTIVSIRYAARRAARR